MRFLLTIISAIALFGSCVSNRKVQMMQKDDVNAKDLLKDTVLRTYKPDIFDYRVQPNDVLYVNFESLTDEKYNFLSTGSIMQQGGLSGSMGGAMLLGELVDEQGQIQFRSVGKVKVGGLTIFEIEQKLQELANKYLESPVVKVRLLNYRLTLLGEVVNEGNVTLSNNRVTMLEAIAQGGGLGEFADRSNIKLIRQRDGNTEIQYINLLDENFIHSPYYYVYQNDVLVVPPLRQKPFRRYFGQNLSLIVSTISLLLLAINLSLQL